MKQPVYIFRGAPASGKGTVVTEFAQLLPGPTALIEHDLFRWGFHLTGRTVTDVTSDEHKFAYDNMVALYENYLARGSYTIVVEGLFTYDDTESSQGNVQHLLDLAHHYGKEAVSIVLTAEKVHSSNATAAEHTPFLEKNLKSYSRVFITI